MPMRLRVHHPLFAGFVGVIGFLVAILVPFVGTGLRSELQELYREELEHQLRLAETLVATSGSAEADSLARVITERIDNRVTFIDLDGVVLGDSYVSRGSLSEVENHIGRPEVKGVLAGEEVSYAQRTSATGVSPVMPSRCSASVITRIRSTPMSITLVPSACAILRKSRDDSVFSGSS